MPGEETIAAIATAPGAGAIGILRLSGPQARQVALGFLQLKKQGELTPRHATLAEARHEGLIDEVITVFFPGPGSATGEDSVELSCHGSPYILKRLLQAALAKGARLARPGEFTQRAFLNGRLDLAQAEAVGDLIGARTSQAHRAALTQLEGGLSRQVKALREPLLDILVRIEANLDHPEEDIPSLRPEDAAGLFSEARGPILALAATFDRGRLAREGARICIVGRPNAGKSSLLNALLGSERAIVCPEPGTTRDTLEECADLEGLSAVLIDTAGLREDLAGPAERSGMERAEGALRACDLALLVIDRSAEPTEEDERVRQRILEQAARQGRPVISVLNKSDLAPRLAADKGDVAVSALKRDGLEELTRLIASRLGASGGAAREAEEPSFVSSERHQRALKAAAAELEAAGAAAAALAGRWEDRAACHLREALRSLGEIIGEGAPDEILDAIFSRFCVGK